MASDALAICVSSKEASLYKEASAKSQVVAKAPRYTPLKWTGNKKLGFFEVYSRDRKKSWIRLSQISPKLICLQVKVKRSQLFDGPGKNFAKAEINAVLGDSFRDLGGEDGWTLVEDREGHRAWINLDHTWKPAQLMRMSFEQ